MDYLNGLNDEQMKAVLCTDGPLLILAGAGSGKTRVLTHRIAYMINDCYIRPSNILAITFTKKAANEMKERVEKLLGDMSLSMWIGTFHSCCARILRMDIEAVGYDRNFVIYDESDALAVIKDAMKTVGVSEKDITPKAVKSIISRAKDSLESEKDFEKKYFSDYRYGKVSKIYTVYQNTLRKNNALDFDDIIFLTVKLFEENEDILEKYRDRFKYIMVDEYQDTNAAQYRLISLLAKKHLNLCVVGDDDQSIYSFRGADITNILNFEKEFPEAQVIRLERNYRSTGNILGSANAVIKHNKMRKGKSLWTENGDGEKVCRYEGENEHAEAAFVVSEISRMVEDNKYKYSDIAVLYRMNTLSRIIEEAFMKSSIPYRIIGGHKFYDRKEIKDIISYLKLLENPNDDYALKRVINVPKRGIGDTTFENIRAISLEEGIPAFEIIRNAGRFPSLSRAAAKLKAFSEIIIEMMEEKENSALGSLIEKIYKSTGMIRELEGENTDEAKARIGNLEEFINVAVEFEQNYIPEADEEFGEEEKPILSAFLESIALISDLDSESGDENYVLLMTMHSSKGLEFPVVFLVGFEDSIFPGNRAMDTESDLEEERRLCYVAITRAKERLYITNASQRMVFGSTQFSRPSRFLKELPAEFLDDRNEAYRKKREESRFKKSFGDSFESSADIPGGFGRKIESAQDINSSFLAALSRKKGAATGNRMKRSPAVGEASPAVYAEGDRVSHKKFGLGVVSRITGSGTELKVEVIFDDCGMKRFMAQYANLEKID